MIFTAWSNEDKCFRFKIYEEKDTYFSKDIHSVDIKF